MNCKNCNTSLSVNTISYCLNCGARIIRNRLTFKGLLKQAGEEFFNLDNRLLKTFSHLITKPQEVINGYIKGTRKKYVNPISFVAISIALSGIQFFIINSFFNNFIENTNTQTTQNINSDVTNQLIKEWMAFIGDYAGIIAFMTIPLMALISYFVFYNIKKYNFVEHNVIYLYTYAVISVLGVLLTVIFFFFRNVIDNWLSLVSIISMPVMILYNFYILKKLHNIGFLRMIWKTIWFLIVGFIIYILVIIVFSLLFFVYLKLGGEMPDFLQQVFDAGVVAGQA